MVCFAHRRLVDSARARERGRSIRWVVWCSSLLHLHCANGRPRKSCMPTAPLDFREAQARRSRAFLLRENRGTATVWVGWFLSSFWNRIWGRRTGEGLLGGASRGGVRSCPGAARTMLRFYTTSARPLNRLYGTYLPKGIQSQSPILVSARPLERHHRPQ
jgi:hypothetical protein